MIAKKSFKPSQSAELAFMRQLKKVARVSGHIVGVHIDGTKIIDEREMQKALAAYSKLITPWARRQSLKMLTNVSKSGTKAIRKNANLIGQGLRLVAESDIGAAAAKLMDEQVELIKSIPIRAGERAQKLAMEAVYSGSRADEIAKQLQATTEVSESDAARIARTEVARSNSYLTQARAEAVGSKRYIWRTSEDAAVRPAHKKMNGKVFNWVNPPTLEDGTTGNPGTFPNCRCYPEPVFDET